MRWTPFGGMSEDEIISRYDRSIIHIQTDDSAVKLGEYLVDVTPCHFCHTRQTWFGPELPLVGGVAVTSAWFGTKRSLNLTSSRTNGVGRETPATLLRSLRTGLDESGRVIERRAMPWDLFSHLSNGDVEAILAYLRRVPAVDRFEGPAQPPGQKDAPFPVIEYILPTKG